MTDWLTGRHDDTIDYIWSKRTDPAQLPELPAIDVFELDGRLYALRGNRRLFVWRVMAYFGVCSTIVVNLLQRDDPMLERVRFDHYRMRREAPKWERHLSSRTDGLVEPGA